MSFPEFWWKGVEFDGGQWKRSSHREDSMKADTPFPTYSYLGTKTSQQMLDGKYWVRWIDGVAAYESPTDELRNEKQEKLNSLAFRANATGWVGLAGVAICGYKAYEGWMKSGLAGAATSGAIAVWSFVKGNEAGEEATNWNDHFGKVCEDRRKLSQDIRGIERADLQGKLFTVAETQDIYHATIARMRNEFERNAGGGNPEVMQEWIKAFVVLNNPFMSHCLRYVYKEKQRISNPRDLSAGEWKRSDLEELGELSMSLSQKFVVHNAKAQGQTDLLNAGTSVASNFTSVAGDLANAAIDSKKQASLTQHQSQRDRQLAAVDRSDASYEERERAKRAIQQDYVNNAQVRQVKADTSNAKTTAGALEIAAQLTAAGVNYLGNEYLKGQHRNQMVQEFQQPVGELFTRYRQTNLRNESKV